MASQFISVVAVGELRKGALLLPQALSGRRLSTR
jgi:hypothetical protein